MNCCIFAVFKTVKPTNIIRSAFGWALLMLFTLSITPKQLLHDVLANHTDNSVETAGNAYVAKPGYNCDRLNLVAESPFTEASAFKEDIPLQPCTDFVIISHHKAVFQAITLPGLRGPPCI